MSNQDHIVLAVTKSNMGGAQKYVLTMAEELHKLGVKVTVIAGGDGLLFEELEKRGIPFVRLAQGQRDISIKKELKLFIELYSVLRKLKPTILHLNSSKLGGSGSFIGRIAGVKKIIFTAHGWAFNEARPKWQKIILYKLYWLTIMLSSKTICVSQETRRQISFLPFIKNKLKVVYNAVSNPNFYTNEEAKNKLCEMYPFLDKNKKWIAVLAELHYTKGHDLLFEAVEEMQSELNDYQIVCMGTGDREGKLKALIHHRDLEKYVFFTGFVSQGSSYLKGFEALCLPSRTEALPLSILEAGLAKIPVIASNVGGIPEVIENDVTGFLFTKENTDELKENLRKVINLSEEEKEKITKRLSEKVAKDFSVEKMVTETYEIRPIEVGAH